MTALELILKQIKSATSWTHYLLDELDEMYFGTAPMEVSSTIYWQLGHIVVSNYFHAIACLHGPQPEIANHFPLKEYVDLYKKGSNPLEAMEAELKPTKEELLKAMDVVMQLIEQNSKELTEEELEEDTELAHPVAKKKFQSLSFCAQHHMWHNGQISMIKRIVTGEDGV